MADFKDELSPELVARIGGDLAAASSAFDRAAFERLACAGLGELELMARVDWIARALATTMPPSAERADRLIRAALDNGGLHGWASMPVNAYVSSTLLDRPDVALPLLAALTPRYTAEFAIRPFIETHYETTMEHLRSWTTDSNEHVRRLVTEGTRPRLPWGRKLARFVADPAPTIALLEVLADDESDYVRRSVANHLNDISKDHPDLALDVARRWSRSLTRGDFVVRHGLRTLIKRGDPATLAVLGFDHDARIDMENLTCSPSTISIGDATTISFALRAAAPTKAAIDYLVHYQGARGPKAGKVFKLTVRDLPGGRAVDFSRRHRFAHVSIRTIHPGAHRIEIQVNGRVLGATEVEVTAGEAPLSTD
ncbi:DNA alkylation repair protein [Tessaracoccus caeni]|uniref:DNA alkylation repair protein n=1 Tax=Tessaracoccus caeni TaxID=3031239 RepID=UPI0023DB4070|nr:DNA alkylation repair protein [Tessaracoccus caeni]MDF1489036.1 DNA alkylation repair protein [Tessaracoccus caeni]